MRIAVLVLVSACMLALVSAQAQCDASCTSANDGVSCLYCPSCGSCQSVGVIDRCRTAGTAHLSIDDGPRGTDPTLLALLRQNNIAASFWLIGGNAYAYPATAASIVQAGHFIGDHTWTHPNCNALSNADMQTELSLSFNAIKNATGVSTTYFRPPFGDMNNNVLNTVKAFPMTAVVWTFDSLDWTGDPTQADPAIQQFIAGLNPATDAPLILTHGYDVIGFTYFQYIINQVKAKGFTFVSAWDCFSTLTNPCSGYTCPNGGTCMPTMGGPSCTPPPAPQPCDPSPCQNGGMCTVSGSSSVCSCKPGYSGALCESSVCTPSPCGAGKYCLPNASGAAQCKALPPVGDCFPFPCMNGGTCHAEGGWFTCTCAPGYSDPMCGSGPILGTCAADGSSCLNGGACAQFGSGYSCTCQDGFVGRHCEHPDCTGDSTCQNGGSCVDWSSGDPYCFCPPGFVGDLCERTG